MSGERDPTRAKVLDDTVEVGHVAPEAVRSRHAVALAAAAQVGRDQRPTRWQLASHHPPDHAGGRDAVEPDDQVRTVPEVQDPEHATLDGNVQPLRGDRHPCSRGMGGAA
jgi:hypothetical protein